MMSLLDVYTNRQTLADVWRAHRGWIMTGLFIIQLLGVYGSIQILVDGGVQPNTALDSYIPIIPIFLIPYCLYYLLLPLPFWLAHKQKSGQQYLFVVAVTFFVAATICNLIFIVFPTEIMRPPVNGSGLMAEAVRYLHTIDGSVALLPSGHVTYSLLAAMITMQFNRPLGYVAWVIAILVMPATVLIKQHYVVDILGGIIVALFAYFLFFLPLWKRLQPHLLAEGSKSQSFI
jgi:membrane-associated phospholipid phosphatase